MRKLVLTCTCGERMQVPRSALGKTGLCPSCGQAIPIRSDNTATLQPGENPAAATHRTPGGAKFSVDGPASDDKRRFGEAVDLYFAKRYAEALAILNALNKKYPGNSEIETGRSLCFKALMAQPMHALEDKRQPLNGKALDPDTVKKFVLDKMLNGASEAVQLQAAELACRMLGMMPNGSGSKADAAEHKEPEKPAAPDPMEILRESLDPGAGGHEG